MKKIIFVLFFAVVFLPLNYAIAQESFDSITSREAKNLMNKTESSIEYLGLEYLFRDFQGNVVDDLNKKGEIVSPKMQKTAEIFIYEGTKNSQKIGIGERMSVIKSFYYAFGHFPKTELDWQDVIKISAGRWPTQRNSNREEEMKKIFEKIYLRQPDMKNQNDNAMITVATYGLRPQSTNYKKQQTAWNYYEDCVEDGEFFSEKWKYQKMWDIIRAVAYSGAKR